MVDREGEQRGGAAAGLKIHVFANYFRRKFQKIISSENGVILQREKNEEFGRGVRERCEDGDEGRKAVMKSRSEAWTGRLDPIEKKKNKIK